MTKERKTTSPADPAIWVHEDLFAVGNRAAERSARLVMWLTLAMMVIEIAAGWWFNSMALLADGWHMSSHALALGLSAFAYAAARRYASDPRFAFGTWKIEVLAGFTSAILLLCVAAAMAFGSVERLLAPKPIEYGEAMTIAALGLVVNVVSALVLSESHQQAHGHGDEHAQGTHHHGHPHQDLNLRSAYAHVITDAATSLLAIVALAGGWLYGWAWLDPVMGLVGALLVGIWAKKLIVETGVVLLDREMDHHVVEEIREVVVSIAPTASTSLSDLHVWRVGSRAYSCAISVETDDPSLTPSRLREKLAVHEEIVHATIEVNLRAAGRGGGDR